MTRPALSPRETLRLEIENVTRHTRRFEKMDFWLAHVFLWTSLIASFAATILVASNVDIKKWCLALIAGIPGLVVAIDKSFEFGKRALWGESYRIALEELKDELSFEKSEPYVVAQKLRVVKRKFAESYTTIGFFTQKRNNG